MRIMKRNLFFDFMEAMEAAKAGLKIWKEETFDVECPGEEIDKDYLLEEYAKEIVLTVAGLIDNLFKVAECNEEEIETEFVITEFADANTKQLDLFFASDVTDEKVVVKFKIENPKNAWHETEDKITEAVENWMRETNLVSNEWVDFN